MDGSYQTTRDPPGRRLCRARTGSHELPAAPLPLQERYAVAKKRD